MKQQVPDVGRTVNYCIGLFVGAWILGRGPWWTVVVAVALIVLLMVLPILLHRRHVQIPEDCGEPTSFLDDINMKSRKKAIITVEYGKTEHGGSVWSVKTTGDQLSKDAAENLINHLCDRHFGLQLMFARKH